jgi:hypothetical protein
MKLIETKTLGADAASIEFTSIPADFDDLVILASVRSSYAADDDPLLYQINGLTSGYSARILYGTGSAASTSTPTTAAKGGVNFGRLSFNGINAATSTSNTFSSVSFYLPNYKLTQQKSISVDYVLENNATFAEQQIVAALSTDTAAVTSIKFAARDGDLVTNTSFSLYGILKGSDGIVTTS